MKVPALVFLAAAVACAEPDYFPLHAGNQWIYRGGGRYTGTTLTLEISRAADFDGNRYYLLRGLPQGDFWLRMTEDSRLLVYDPDKKEEQVWYAFQSREGEIYQTALPFCCGKAAIRSRAAAYKSPIGPLENLLELNYPGVFQVGIDRELFLPYIGMVYRGLNTGGATFGSYDLIYARIGGVTVVSAPEVSFSLTIDRAIYPQGAEMTARLALRNTQDEPLRLVFPSGQTFDLAIQNEAGVEVWRWSRGKLFTLGIRNETVGPGENNEVLLAPLPFPPGQYKVEAWLATMPRFYVAVLGFEIR
ncbi:MAG: hypothetical protein HYR60_10630 [Acidobacteria bacterium]|nr:hypothetical protein [Acidobacteriota bacterium]